ncbi:MarR family transcriptional regulator [Paenibacillus piri]|uniref:HTH-type transcriptional regulator SarZ n=1 Tax=Paenibacillus piri TaxID=2547395 RepID=A0A4R5KSC2_9BACL|nr:MarR family transcriptional regulator [Paenibacillus piri]
MTEQIAANFVQLLPLVYNKLNKPASKNTAVTRPSDLTHLQLHILEELFHAKEGVSMTQLSQHISISKQQLTPLIMKLEEKDYVSKVQDHTDRRSVILMLTEKGRTTVLKRWGEFHRLFCNQINTLSDDDLSDLDYAIKKIIRIFGKLGNEV